MMRKREGLNGDLETIAQVIDVKEKESGGQGVENIVVCVPVYVFFFFFFLSVNKIAA